MLRHLLAQRQLAALIFAAALLMKVAVPAGYMVSNVAGWPAITLCSEVTPAMSAMDETMHAGMAHDMSADHRKSHDRGKAEMPCVFTALTAATLAATDAVILAALIAFVMALAIIGISRPRRAEPARSRPPLRGPPALS